MTVLRNRLATLAVVLAMASVLAAVTPAFAEEPSPELELAGSGWGHGIGMSQYGAYGQALEGATANEILAYYYEGSAVGTMEDQLGSNHWLLTDPRPLLVNVVPGETVIRFRALGGNLTVCQNGDCGLTARPGEKWAIKAIGDGKCRLTVDGEPARDPGGCSANVKGMTPGGAHVKFVDLPEGRKEFARGRLVFRSPNGGDTLHAVLELELDEYLYGLGEMPRSWPDEALRAQVIAGRSYAVVKAIGQGPGSSLTSTRKTQCWCHVYSSTLDQSYIGWINETGPYADDWAGAVDTTSERVVTHPAAPGPDIVQAFYSSSTGGATENNEDIWGGSPVSYLRSRPDPWSSLSAVNNPNASWRFSYDEAALAAAFGVNGIDGIEIVSRFESGTPAEIVVHARAGGGGSAIETTAGELSAALGMGSRRHIDDIVYGRIDAFAGNFDGGQRDDVAMLMSFNRAWWVGASEGDSFSMSSWANQGVNTGWGDTVVGDFNGDGKDDVATYRPRTGAWRVATGGTSFVFGDWGSQPRQASRWSRHHVGDFSGDGRDDIAAYNPQTGKWKVLVSTGSGFALSKWYRFATPQSLEFVEVGDFDNDGRDDLIHVTEGHSVTVLNSDGKSFSEVAWHGLSATTDWDGFVVLNVDAVRGDDLAAYDAVEGRWTVLISKFNGRSRSPAVWWDGHARDFEKYFAADVHDDGIEDIVSYDAEKQNFRVFRSEGTRLRRSNWRSSPGTSISDVLVLDADADGRHDVATFSSSTRTWWVGASDGDRFAFTEWGDLLR